MIFGVLSLLNATLTLPGIAGIVLTVGIAVDSNVLIYERIREEVRAGRTPINAIDAGFTPRARHHSRLQHHHLHRRRGAVLHRHRPGARLCRDARHRHHHHGVHRLHADAADRGLLGALAAAAAPCRSERQERHAMRLLRIVPDDTKFDFMRFRRISFPMSALLSILAISLYFFHGLNFGIDFIGGTLIEVQTKAGPADLAKMRATLGGARPRRSAAAAVRRAQRRADPHRASSRAATRRSRRR